VYFCISKSGNKFNLFMLLIIGDLISGSIYNEFDELVHKPQHISIKNKKAFFDYEILETFYAGIQLAGTEIKSIRGAKASLVDSYCSFFAKPVVRKEHAHFGIRFWYL